MITIDQLLNEANAALCEHFTAIINGVKIEPDVYDHTEEIFDEGAEDVAVWCDVNYKAFPWYDGKPSFIICWSNELDDGSIDFFIGDRCTDLSAAKKALAGFDGDDVWSVDITEDFLVLSTDFTLDDNATLAQVLSSKLATLKSPALAEAIAPAAKYFK